MRPFQTLLGVVVALGVFGCEAVVKGGGDDGGEGGGGGGSGEGAQGPSGPITSTSTGMDPNPAECPASPPVDGPCAIENLECSYLEEAACTVSYVCVWEQECGGDSSAGTGGSRPSSTSSYGGGYGGDGNGGGDCYAYTYWQVTGESGKCCHGDCNDECEPVSCPDSIPYDGAPCDPCWDAESCAYTLDDECGVVQGSASCDPDTSTWVVDESC